MRTWRVEEAKARFSELLNTCVNEGPQLVTKRGTETAVVVPIKEWRRLQERARPTLKDWLLAEHPRFDDGLPVPPRGRGRRRPVPDL